VCLVEAGLEIADDLKQAGHLLGVCPQQRAPDARVLVLAGASVGAGADAEFDFAPLEVAEEFFPFLVGGLPVLGAGAQRPAAADERTVMLDDVLGVDGGVALGRGYRGVAHELGEDWQRQPGGQTGRERFTNHAE
jgi:hypothetical protein